MVNRSFTLKETIDSINLVMFNKEFKKYAYMSIDGMKQHAADLLEQYDVINSMIEQKIFSVIDKQKNYLLRSAQINNYMAFKNLIKKKINGKSIVNLYYKRMSFGLVEFYYDILTRIIIVGRNNHLMIWVIY